MVKQYQDYEPMSKLWNFKEYWYGETAKYHQGRMQAYVLDMDGDDTEWMVWYDHKLIASGHVMINNPSFFGNDFHEGIRLVEEILIERGYLYDSRKD